MPLPIRRIALVLLLGSALHAGQTASFAKLGALEVGKPLPHFAAFDPDGKPTNTRKLLQEPAARRLFVSFQTTCAPCLKGILALQAARERLERAKVQVVLVDIQEGEDAAHRFVQEHGVTFSVLTDPYGRMAGTALGATRAEGNSATVAQLPTSVLADASGKVIAIFGQEGDDWIERVLK